MIGRLGAINFEVSDNRIMTISDLKQSGSATFGKHQRHGKDTLVEYVGADSDTLSFSILLSAQLGANVEEMLSLISMFCYRGDVLPLVIGGKVFGRNKWVIQKYSVDFKNYDKKGRPILAKVSLTLLEYLK